MAEGKVEKLYFLVCFIIIALVLGMYIPDPYLWYDEAGQFWISQGLNHYSAPLAPHGSLKDVILFNRDYNMDPGGFSVVLYFWQLISTHWLFLRLLPVLFFIGFSFCLYKITLLETKSRFFAIILSTLYYLLPVFTNRVAELRAYPMELFGTALSLFLLMKYKDSLTYRRLLLLLVVQMIFCTSRYGYVIVAFCVTLRVLYLLFRQTKNFVFIRKAAFFCIPLLAVVVVLYLGMMKNQSSEGSVISYTGYISSDMKLLYSPMSLCFYALIAVYVYSCIKKKSNNEVLLMGMLISGVYYILSIMGYYPWDMHRTISAFFLLSFGLVLCLLKYLNETKAIKVIALCGLCAMATVFVAFFDRIHQKDTDKLIEEYVQFLDNNEFEKMLVQVHMNPVIRYQYEHGLFKERQLLDHYPEKYVFQIGLPHSMHTSDAPIPQTYFDVVWSTDGDIKPEGYTPINGYTNFYEKEN